jgi:hypothetical protein
MQQAQQAAAQPAADPGRAADERGHGPGGRHVCSPYAIALRPTSASPIEARRSWRIRGPANDALQPSH